MQVGCEGEKHALPVGPRRLQGMSLQNAQGGGRTIAVNPGFRVGLDAGDEVSVEGRPLAAGEFNFGKFGHGMRIRAFPDFEIGIWHGMRLESGSGG